MEKLLTLLKTYKKQFAIVAGAVITIAIFIIVIVLLKNPNEKSTASSTADTETQEETVFETTEIVEAIDDPQPQEIQAEEGVKINASSLSDNNYSTSGKTYGIDVSKWQGAIDWQKVKASGVEFAMIRVGYRTEGNGTILEDPYAKYNLQKANDAGIKVGVYFFSTAVSTAEAQEEAAWVTSLISKYKITYPVVYNCEGYSQIDSRMYSLSNTERTNNAIAFLNYVQSQGYASPMFYGNSGELTNSKFWNTETISSSFKIWIAQYPGSSFTEDSKSSYAGSYSIWQYTNKGIVDGINGYVDMDVAYFGFSSETAPKDSSGTGEVSLPTQASTTYNPYQAANDVVTAKIETNLRTVASSADSSTIVYLLKNGETVERTAIGTNGWSKVLYNGQTLFAKTSNLTTNIEPTTTAQTATVQTTTTQATTADPFYAINDQVTAKTETNLRTVPSSADPTTVVYLLKNGEYVTRTGRTEESTTNGWSRVEYNGQTLYALSSYLKN